MNSTDKKYIYGAITFVLVLTLLEITSNLLLSNDLSSTIFYDDRKLIGNLELTSSDFSVADVKKIRINVFDDTNGKNAENTTLFITISNNNEDLLRKYFFSKDGDLLINIQPNNDLEVQIGGEQKYDFDAFTMSETTPIQIVGPIFNTNEKYSFKIKLVTIDDVENVVFGLTPFEFQVSTDDVNLQKNNSFVPNQEVVTQPINFLEFAANQDAHLNNFGFRGPDIDITKPNNMERIFLVGGSTVYGAGESINETTIPGFLQKIIDEESINYKFEIINAGIQGANSNQESKLIEQQIIDLKPDFLIMFDGWSDLLHGHDSKTIFKNWNNVCQLGIENDFDVIIILQPIAGFGDKILTQKEYYQSHAAKDESGQQLITKVSEYDGYTAELSNIDKRCVASDFRGIFNDVVREVYWDEGHLNDYGNLLIANEVHKLYFLDYIADISKNETHLTNENSFTIDFNVPLSFKEIVSYYKTPILLNEIFN